MCETNSALRRNTTLIHAHTRDRDRRRYGVEKTGGTGQHRDSAWTGRIQRIPQHQQIIHFIADQAELGENISDRHHLPLALVEIDPAYALVGPAPQPVTVHADPVDHIAEQTLRFSDHFLAAVRLSPQYTTPFGGDQQLIAHPLQVFHPYAHQGGVEDGLLMRAPVEFENTLVRPQQQISRRTFCKAIDPVFQFAGHHQRIFFHFMQRSRARTVDRPVSATEIIRLRPHQARRQEKMLARIPDIRRPGPADEHPIIARESGQPADRTLLRQRLRSNQHLGTPAGISDHRAAPVGDDQPSLVVHRHAHRTRQHAVGIR